MVYVYGIYDKEKNILLYIGSTDNYLRRFKEHSKALSKGKHTNKTLQKYFNEHGLTDYDLEFKVLYSLDTDNSLLKYFLEMLCISAYRPACNKCVISIGNSRLTFARADKEISKKIIDVIMENA